MNNFVYVAVGFIFFVASLLFISSRKDFEDNDIRDGIMAAVFSGIIGVFWPVIMLLAIPLGLVVALGLLILKLKRYIVSRMSSTRGIGDDDNDKNSG